MRPTEAQIFKANFDAAVFKSCNLAGIGVIIRDWCGEAIGSLNMSVPLFQFHYFCIWPHYRGHSFSSCCSSFQFFAMFLAIVILLQIHQQKKLRIVWGYRFGWKTFLRILLLQFLLMFIKFLLNKFLGFCKSCFFKKKKKKSKRKKK